MAAVPALDPRWRYRASAGMLGLPCELLRWLMLGNDRPGNVALTCKCMASVARRSSPEELSAHFSLTALFRSTHTNSAAAFARLAETSSRAFYVNGTSMPTLCCGTSLNIGSVEYARLVMCSDVCGAEVLGDWFADHGLFNLASNLYMEHVEEFELTRAVVVVAVVAVAVLLEALVPTTTITTSNSFTNDTTV